MLYKGSSMGKWSLCLNVLLQIFIVLRVLVRKRESIFLIVRRELLGLCSMAWSHIWKDGNS
jgi:hypothetical protein